jgi:galactokinase
MTGARLAARLVAAGLPPTELPGKTLLCEAALDAFRAAHGADPEHAWWVPGRLELFGKHTDYAGGRTIVAPAPRGFVVIAARRRDATIHLVDARTGETVTLSPAGDFFTGWRNYVSVAVSRLTRNFPGPRSGATIAFASDLPRASGMSSSSALVVGVATALSALWNLPARDDWNRSIRTPADVATYFASLENGATFRELGGDEGVGTHGGSEDHAAMLLGQPGSFSALSFVPMCLLDVVPLPDAWTVVIATSGVKAEKTGAARDSYNRLSDGAQHLLATWNRHHPPARSLAAALGSSSSALKQLKDSVRHIDIDGWPADALERRLEHFVREDARILTAAEALRAADHETLARLSDESQRDATELLDNQIPETITLAAAALDAGAFAACSFGAGFGGSVWALVGNVNVAEFMGQWLKRYRARHPDRDGIAFIAPPGPPVTDLSAEPT